MPKLLILPRETVRTPYHYKSGECVPYAARGVLSSEADWEAALSGAVRRDLIFIYPESENSAGVSAQQSLCTDNELENCHLPPSACASLEF